MGQMPWRVLVVAGVIVAAAAAVVAGVMGGCSTCLETTSESCSAMTCVWTFHAVIPLEVVAAYAFAGLVPVRHTMGRRWLAGVTALVQVAVVVTIYTPLIGLCGNAAMWCHTTATVVTCLVVVMLVLCVVAMVKADPNPDPKPKRGI